VEVVVADPRCRSVEVCDLVGGERDLGCGGVLYQAFRRLVPGIGTIWRCWASSEASATCPGVASAACARAVTHAAEANTPYRQPAPERPPRHDPVSQGCAVGRTRISLMVMRRAGDGEGDDLGDVVGDGRLPVHLLGRLLDGLAGDVMSPSTPRALGGRQAALLDYTERM
jgi:hypothetical protein